MAIPRKHNIVAVDSWVKLADLSFDHNFTQYPNTTPAELPDRIKDATIVICSGTRINRAAIENAPNLQLVACNGTGTDHIDKDALRERGVSLCRVPAQNTDSVSEHAFALYYALRRKVIEMHRLTLDGTSWAEGLGTLPVKVYGRPGPRVNAEETLVVIGHGAIGRNVAKIGQVLGMKVLIAERKDASSVRADRTAFSEAIKQGTIFILAAPLDDSTRDMISSPEFSCMNPSALLVNIGRGGVVNELALIKALRGGRIAGAATDVFESEPATKENCPLLDPTIPNLILSPHTAWYSERTVTGTIATVKANLEAFAAGKPQNLVLDCGKDCL